jgi:hypothetical protein
VGVNTFGNMPRKIVEFLQLPNPQSYTGHSFRRSSATLLAGKGVNFLGIKRLGGWKSSALAEGYIEDSLHEKIAIADQLAAGSSSRSSLHNPLPSTSKCTWEPSTMQPSTEELNSNDVQAPSTLTASMTIILTYLSVRKFHTMKNSKNFNLTIPVFFATTVHITYVCIFD